MSIVFIVAITVYVVALIVSIVWDKHNFHSLFILLI
jgi:hypothetical protein